MNNLTHVMGNPGLFNLLLRWGGLGLAFFGLFVGTWSAMADQEGPVYRYWMRYTSMLERKLRPMFIFTPGRVIAVGQLLALVLIVAAALTVEIPFWWVLIILAILGPSFQIDMMRRKRIEQIEFQIDGFMLALANALKAIPSISAAFQSVAPILQPPIQQEVELAIKEMKVGSTLDQSLLHMASRIGSRSVDSGLSAILIGRQVGGNLPKVLETTAASLREMQRLEGVVKTKTAEGKAQLWVIGLLPFGFIIILNYFTPGYFDPLKQSVTGYMIGGIAGSMWVSALFLARKILAVDI
jgi:tight adherence protein B